MEIDARRSVSIWELRTPVLKHRRDAARIDELMLSSGIVVMWPECEQRVSIHSHLNPFFYPFHRSLIRVNPIVGPTVRTLYL